MDFSMNLQSSGTGSGERRTKNLVINYKEQQYKIRDVCPETYTHVQLLSDVSSTVLMNAPRDMTVYVAMYLPIPGTNVTMEVVNDADLKIMFGLYSKAEDIDLVLLVTHDLPLPGRYEEELGHGYAIADPGPNPIWFSIDDVRRKGSILPEFEDWSVDLGKGPDSEKMIGMLRTDITINDGCGEADGILKMQAATPQFCPCRRDCPFNSPAEQGQAGAEPEVDYAEVDQWLSVNGEPEKH